MSYYPPNKRHRTNPGNYSGRGNQRNFSQHYNRYEGDKQKGFRHEQSFHKMSGGHQRMPEPKPFTQLVKQKLTHGTRGEPIELISNFYNFLHADRLIHHYSVNIKKIFIPRHENTKSSGDETFVLDEEKKTAQMKFIKRFAEKIFDSFVKENSKVFGGITYVYDGYANLYTTKELDQLDDNYNLKVNIEGRIGNFLIDLKCVRTISLSEVENYYRGKSGQVSISEEVLSIFEIIFRFIYKKEFAINQRKFFDLSQIIHEPKVRICDFVQGFFSSVRMTEFGLALNVHLKTSCIISKSYTKLIELIGGILNIDLKEFDRNFRFRPEERSKANKIIRHLKVGTMHSKQTCTYIIDRISEKYPKDEKFPYRGKSCSIDEYFQLEYNIILKSLPLVKIAGKNNIYLPMEMCTLVEPQFLSQNKIDQNIQRELLFKSTHVPNVYFNKTSNFVKRIQEIDSDGILKRFGIQLDPQAARIKGRVLPIPNTISKKMDDKFFHTVNTPPEWMIFALSEECRKNDLENFAFEMKKVANNLGLSLPKPHDLVVRNISTEDHISNIFSNIIKRTPVGIVIVGIPTRHPYLTSTQIYNKVKSCCDVEYGLMSQCFNLDKLRRIPPGYMSNFILKFNAKIRGQNTSLHENEFNGFPFDRSNTMLVGIDVNHKGESEVSTSIAAVVGTYDSSFYKYTSSVRVQAKDKEEIVRDLEEMMYDILKEYKSKNGYYPQNVIVFRDGVSDGQFKSVEQYEIPMIVNSFKKVDTQCKLTVIIIQKRHHTRFALAKQDTNGRKPTYNVPMGTVVDTEIVDPTLKVFYLNSHFSPLGTSKPTKYIVLRDDLLLSTDQVQHLCFNTCFQYARTRDRISMPVPTKYADLLAYRAKQYVEHLSEKHSIEDMNESIKTYIYHTI
ncbi:hypothetical protein RDWZM_003469 [Blomia tropicalis]|uniref:Uncharacterized protein n=1 Tax=Blomia tropicalis TaxID=40697 RepID=A0A9Q0MFL7_BLOTA|nr:hypothetical protein RDWZM_003469 [Blomia tropicalis]